MQKLITATKKEFSVKWCAVSTFDNALRFEVVNSPIANILSVVMNPEETETLTCVFDKDETVFTGYTQFKGVEVMRGSVIVSLTGGAL